MDLASQDILLVKPPVPWEGSTEALEKIRKQKVFHDSSETQLFLSDL
jgi:hypothetical protein